MLARLREKPGAERVEAMVGDMATTRVEGEFALVYLVFNTIFNLTTQDGQVACFETPLGGMGPGAVHCAQPLARVGLRQALSRTRPPGRGLRPGLTNGRTRSR